MSREAFVNGVMLGTALWLAIIFIVVLLTACR